MNDDTIEADFTNPTAEIVSAYVANNAVHQSDLPRIITSVHDALQKLGAPKVDPVSEKPEPHMLIKKTITPDHLISLEDRRSYKSLKRHLATRGMTPDDYRAKWGLPSDYPMVAPNYAKQRSELAKKFGLGQLRSQKPTPEPEAARLAPKKRGRSPKAMAEA
jgi:predicted transcriptional regulator